LKAIPSCEKFVSNPAEEGGEDFRRCQLSRLLHSFHI
jgi:hypothetical protein